MWGAGGIADQKPAPVPRLPVYGPLGCRVAPHAGQSTPQKRCGRDGEAFPPPPRSPLEKTSPEIDARGILATPANSYINELVTEAARLSIAQDGLPATINYKPTPRVRLRA